jgi:hypothetical protein
MKALHIQVQLERAPGLDELQLKQSLGDLGVSSGLAKRVRVEEGIDHGRYVNFTYWTEDLPGLWALVRKDVLGSLAIGTDVQRTSIIVCQGDDGWNDYLLLHHFDDSQVLDRLGDTCP